MTAYWDVATHDICHGQLLNSFRWLDQLGIGQIYIALACFNTEPKKIT